MHKTHHRRRRHHNRRTRRGGVKNAPASASASAAPPDIQTIINRVKELAAQAQAQAQAQPMKPSRSRSSRSGISKSQAAEKRFKDILAGKVKHSDKSAFKGPVIRDSQAARARGLL